MKLSKSALERLIAKGQIKPDDKQALVQALSHQSGQTSPHKTALRQLKKRNDLYSNNMEYWDQIILLHWLELYRADLYELVYAIPNGGLRGGAAAGQMKATGQKSGYPDIALDLPRGRYHGLRIELKRGDGKGQLSESQKIWRDRLQRAGYAWVCCHGYRQAIAVLTAYADLGHGQFDGASLMEFEELPPFPVLYERTTMQFFASNSQ